MPPKSTTPHPAGDLLISALRAAGRNPKMRKLFKSTLAKSRVFIFFKNDGQLWKIQSLINGKPQEHAPCFSNPRLAALTWARLAGINENKGKEVQIRSVNAMRFFFDAALKGLPVTLNFKNPPQERYFFNLKEIKEILLMAPWAAGEDNPPRSSPDSFSRETRRSRQGRSVVSDPVSKVPVDEVDFDAPMTRKQLAAIFETSENEIARQISLLADQLDIDQYSIALEAPDSRKTQVYYDPLVAFHIGNRLETDRGEEFRRWFVNLIYDFWRERRAEESESADLKNKLESTVITTEELQAAMEVREQNLETLQATINQLNQELLNQNRLIAELKNDLKASGAWDYPESISEAKKVAAARYSSRMIFHQRVDQSIDGFSLNQNIYGALAAVKIFKALAECLYELKFEKQAFSEEQFRNETGLVLSMTESRASKRDQAIEDSRKCFYEGREITFYPHIKDKIQGVDFRVHFQFLEAEKKILVCHVGEHLPNAKTKYMN